MSEVADDLDVILEAPEKPADDPVVEVADAAPDITAPAVVEPEEGIEALRKQIAAEKARTRLAEQQAQQHAVSAVQAQNEVQDTNIHLINSAIDQVNQNIGILKANYSAAMANGDWDQASELQFQMSANAAQLMQLNQGKQNLEARPKQSAPIPVADPVEALAGQLSPRSGQWVRAHPEFATDQRLFQKMLGAHNVVTADGVQADTEEYFRRVESVLGIGQPVDDNPTAQAARPVQDRTSPPAAPVSRQAAGSQGNTVRLSREEVEMAENMGMTAAEYARSKQTLIKEGKLNG